MTGPFFLSIVATGFAVAFAHAAIPTHWLPFVLAGRGQGWGKPKTLAVVVICGVGHVVFTALLGVLVVWLGIETSKWTGEVFPWIAGGALIFFGLYFLVRQVRGGGHGHHHFGGRQGHHDRDHTAHGHAHAGHDHPSESKRIDTGHGVLVLEIHEESAPPRFRVRTEGAPATLPDAATISLETVRTEGIAQAFSFAARDGYLESLEIIPEPHEFSAALTLSHGNHAHRQVVRFEEHGHAAASTPPAAAADRPQKMVKSDRAAVLSLFTLLTFSPCEGFLPVYLSGIAFGWAGFVVLSAVLALATIAGMVVFTWLTMSGMARLRFRFLERYESGILGGLILFLGGGIIFFGF